MPQKQLYTYAILFLICNSIGFVFLQFQFEFIPLELYQWIIFFYNIGSIALIIILWYYVEKIRNQSLSIIAVGLYALAMLADTVFNFIPVITTLKDPFQSQIYRSVPGLLGALSLLYIAIQLVRNNIGNAKKQSNLKLYGYSILLTFFLTLFFPIAGPILLGYENLNYLRYIHLLNIVPMILAIRMYYSKISAHSSDEDDELLIDNQSFRETL